MEFILLSVLAAAALILLLVLAVILCAVFVPVDIALGAVLNQEMREFSWRISWGILSVRTDPDTPETIQLLLLEHQIYRFVKTGPGPDTGEKAAGGEPVPEEGLYHGMSTILPFLTDIVPVIRKRVHFQTCACHLVFGMDSPAGTGVMYGWLCAARGLLYALPGLDIRMVPVFDRQVFNLRLDAVIRITFPLLTGLQVSRIVRRHFPVPEGEPGSWQRTVGGVVPS